MWNCFSPLSSSTPVEVRSLRVPSSGLCGLWLALRTIQLPNDAGGDVPGSVEAVQPTEPSRPVKGGGLLPAPVTVSPCVPIASFTWMVAVWLPAALA